MSRKIEWCVFAVVGVGMLGCVIDPGGGAEGEDDDGGIFDTPFTPAPDDDWEEEVEERREERDDPNSVNYRGDFSLEVAGEGVAKSELDGEGLGEATFKNVSEDLVGTPPHCQITLADRESDTSGLQGYVIVQYFGSSCASVSPGTYALKRSWEEAGEGGYVIKTVQLEREVGGGLDAYDYRGGEGSIEITYVERGSLIQGVITGEMRELTLNDEPTGGELSVEGAFGAVPSP